MRNTLITLKETAGKLVHLNLGCWSREEKKSLLSIETTNQHSLRFMLSVWSKRILKQIIIYFNLMRSKVGSAPRRVSEANTNPSGRIVLPSRSGMIQISKMFKCEKNVCLGINQISSVLAFSRNLFNVKLLCKNT